MSRRRRPTTVTKANRPGAAVAVQPQATFTAEQVLAAVMAAQKPNTAMARPLPRLEPPAVPFGPGVPLQPASINPQRDGDGRAYPRQFEYPVSWNLPGFSDRLIPWAILRSAADIPLFRQCIETRKNELATRDWDVTISAKAIERAQRGHPNSDRKTIEKALQEKVNPHIGRLVAFWEEPDPWEGLDFVAWATKALEEYFVLDAIPVYPRLNRAGDLYGLEVLDGTTVKPLLDQYGHRPLPPAPAYQQILYGFPRGEFVADTITDPDTGADTVLDGYERDQLVYVRHHVRTFTPYGHSAVERALQDGDLWMRRHGWLRAEYTDGVMPSGWLEAGEGQADWSPQQLSEYERAFNDYYAGATQTRQRFRILPYGMKPSQSTDVGEKYKPEYDLFLLKLVIRHFDTTMAELGFTEPGGLGSAGWHEGQADVQERTANRPTLMRLQALCTRLMRKYLNCPDELEFRFLGMQSEDEANEDGIWAQRIKDGRATLNEDRDRTGLPRYNFPAADMPAVMSPRGLIFLEGAEKLAPPGTMISPPHPDMISTMPQADPMTGEMVDPTTGDVVDDQGPAGSPGGGATPAGPTPVQKTDLTGLARAELKAYQRWRTRRGDRPTRPFQLQVLTKADFTTAGLDVPGDVTFKADTTPAADDTGGGVGPKAPAWPGWAVDTAIAAAVAAQISQALPGATDVAALAAAFLTHRGPTDTPPSVDEILHWLDTTPLLGQLATALTPPVEQAYTEGYLAGGRSAVHLLTGGPIDFTGWTPGDIDAARQLLTADGKHELLSQLLSQSDVTIKSVANTRYRDIAKVLADGLDQKLTLRQMERALRQILDDPTWARMVAITETSRAMTAAALDEYERSGIAAVEWLTTPQACPICLANEAAGPIPLGERFPSGDYGPPAHPHCRCVPIPARLPDVTKALFDESKHPRGYGGKFAPGSGGTVPDSTGSMFDGGVPVASPNPAGAGAGKGRGGKKAGGKHNPAGNTVTMAYNPKTGVGPGYNMPNGSPRVKGLQTDLNRLGIHDNAGHQLAVDGRLGPLTTQAVQNVQRALGLKPDGRVTPQLLARLNGLKTLPGPKQAKPAKSKTAKAGKAAKAAGGAVRPVAKVKTATKIDQADDVYYDAAHMVWVWDPAKHPRGPDGKFISIGGTARRATRSVERATRKAAGQPATRKAPEIGHHIQHLGGLASQLQPSHIERPIRLIDEYLGYVRGAELDAVAKHYGVKPKLRVAEKRLAIREQLAARYGPKAVTSGAPTSIRISGRDRLDDIARDLHGQTIEYEGRRRRQYDAPYDLHLQKIVKTQGFDAKPQVVTKEHLDQAVKEGWTEVWRGVTGIPGAKRPADINHDLRFGQFEPGRGIYGNGVYTSVRRVSAEAYRGREPVRAAAPGRDFTLDDLDGEAYPDSLLRMAIDPQAKVVNYDDVTPQLREWRQGVASDSPEALALSDAGRFAAAKGYDVMLVRGHSDGAFYPGWENSTDDDFTGGIGHPDQYVILNRSVIMIQRAEDEV